MADTHRLISRNTLSSSTTSVVFSDIPQTYTDLSLSISAQTTASGHTVWFRCNGLTTSIYRSITIGGGTSTLFEQYYGGITAGILAHSNNGFTTARMSIESDFFNYTNTNHFKSCMIQSGQGNGYIEQTAGTFGTTDALTSLTIYISGGPSFETGGVFSLYGITRA